MTSLIHSSKKKKKKKTRKVLFSGGQRKDALGLNGLNLIDNELALIFRF